MISYKDQAFCSQSRKCGNTGCCRNLSKLDEARAVAAKLPIAYADFRDGIQCIGFVETENAR